MKFSLDYYWLKTYILIIAVFTLSIFIYKWEHYGTLGGISTAAYSLDYKV